MSSRLLGRHMKTNGNKYIITNDLHLRPDKPRCRLDEDWMDTQRKAIQFVYDTAVENNADVIIAGDLFHYPHVPDFVKNMFLEIALASKRKTYIIPGQHDLPWHSWDKVHKSSFGTIWELVKAGHPYFKYAKEIADAAPYGQEIEDTNKNMVIMHRLVYKNSVPEYIDDGIIAEELLKQFEYAGYIICGDNHDGFIYEEDYRYVINTGCLIRQAADKKNYQPFICLLDTDKGIVKKIFVPDQADLVTDEYLKDEEERSEKVEAFVSSIKKGKDVSLSFEDNLKKAIQVNKKKLGDGVIKIIQEVLTENRKELV